VYHNPIDYAIDNLFEALSFNFELDPNQDPLLQLLVPFKLLAMRSAQQVTRTARASSMIILPKALCRMVGGMLG
jgi:hypothetical protein